MNCLLDPGIIVQVLVFHIWATVKFGHFLWGVGIQISSSSFEIVHCLGRESRSLVMDGGSLMSFVHWDSGVHYLRLNSLLLDDWLNVVVYVMVSSFSAHDGCCTSGVLGVVSKRFVLVLGCILI